MVDPFKTMPGGGGGGGDLQLTAGSCPILPYMGQEHNSRLLSNIFSNSKIPYPLQIVGMNGILTLALNL